MDDTDAERDRPTAAPAVAEAPLTEDDWWGLESALPFLLWGDAEGSDRPAVAR